MGAGLINIMQQVSSSLGRDDSLAPVCELVQHAGDIGAMLDLKVLAFSQAS